MRVASVSDIHLDYRANREVFKKMVAEIASRNVDAVLVVGDVSHIDDFIAACIAALKRVVDVVAYVPGNHDLWVDRPGEDLRADPSVNTWERHDAFLRSLVESQGGHYLPAAPLRLGSVAVAGSCGWYDYSFFREPFRRQVPDSALEEQAFNGLQWGDRIRTAFRTSDGDLMSDAEVARQMEDRLALHLRDLESDSEVEQVICVTHHQQYEETVRRAGVLPWEFFNAFMGTRRMGEVIDAHPKVTNVIYGHTHILGDRMLGSRRVFGTPLGYPRERRGVSDEEVLQTRIGWIDL